MSQKYSQLSLDLIKQLDALTIKSEGIYFTPRIIIDKCIQYVKKYVTDNHLEISDILEPSFGSGEFIKYLYHEFSNSHITGIELNRDIYNKRDSIILDQEGNGETRIKYIHQDFIRYDKVHVKKYDLIIGNPPYYVIKRNDVDEDYNDYFDGRPNIFILFIIHSLNKLKENGILAFVLPKNFLNCLFYNKCREYIYSYFKILHIEDCSGDNFVQTSQDTILCFIQRVGVVNQDIKTQNDRYSLKTHDYTVFHTSKNIAILRDLYKDSTTLYSQNCDVKIGSIVWNQVKSKLTDDSSKTLLIYSSDIKDNTFIQKKYKDTSKKNYIDRDGKIGPLLLLNRGYGKGHYACNYCLLDIQTPYLIENHLLCIENIGNPHITYNELIDLYNKIIHSLKSEKTQQFIQIYFGNNSINSTELKYIIPFYIDTDTDTDTDT